MLRVTGGQYCVGLERDPLALDREGGFGDRLVFALGTARGAVDGFDGFNDPVNRPTRCPKCKNEAVTEPTFTIED